MKFIVDIPKEFEKDFSSGAFRDSMERLAYDAHCLAGNYEKEIAAMLIEVFDKAVVVPNDSLLVNK